MKLTAAEINEFCEDAFNQSADLFDLRVFDFARMIEAEVTRRWGNDIHLPSTHSLSPGQTGKELEMMTLEEEIKQLQEQLADSVAKLKNERRQAKEIIKHRYSNKVSKSILRFALKHQFEILDDLSLKYRVACEELAIMTKERDEWKLKYDAQTAIIGDCKEAIRELK